MNDEPRNARRYPFDYDAMNKGDRIEPDVIETIAGVNRTQAEYSLKTMTLVKRIEAELWERGKCYTVCVQDFGISILTDVEASEYNANRFNVCRQGMARANTKMAQVDTGELTEEARKKHDNNLKYQGAMLAAMVAARRRELAPVGPEPQGCLPGAV